MPVQRDAPAVHARCFEAGEAGHVALLIATNHNAATDTPRAPGPLRSARPPALTAYRRSRGVSRYRIRSESGRSTIVVSGENTRS